MPESTPRRASRSGFEAPGSSRSALDRKEKARSEQQPPPSQGRRASKQADSALDGRRERPKMGGRTNSAPLVEKAGQDRAPGRLGAVEQGGGKVGGLRTSGSGAPGARPETAEDAQDEDEVAGVVGAVRKFEPFRSSEVSKPLPDINIAVIGAEGVGKSTFAQRALNMPYPPVSQAAERKIPVDSGVYLVRLLELDIEDVAIHDEDNTVSWPETIGDKVTPKIDGALTLYDVTDKSSLDSFPETLSAIGNTGIPFILIACKCDALPAEREVDPMGVENTARRSLQPLATLQISSGSAEQHKRGISMILRSILSGSASNQIISLKRINAQRGQPAYPRDVDHPPAHTPSPAVPPPQRSRTQSNAARPVSPRPPSAHGHARASSEYNQQQHRLSPKHRKPQPPPKERHSRHDSRVTGDGAHDRLKSPPAAPPHDEMQGSFLIEESASEMSDSDHQSNDDGRQQASAGASQSSSLSEQGETFDDLVDRLLAQPTSKADTKFAVVFLALYRHFAAPGKLLEAIVERFDALERDAGAQITTTVNQLRYLSIVEQWVGSYPGDFAHPKTRRRMRTFVIKLSRTRIFSVAAREISADLDAVHEDDDTKWAYNDEDREASGERTAMSPFAQALIDDLDSSFADDLNLGGGGGANGSNGGGATMRDDMSTAVTIGGDTVRSGSGSGASSTTSSQIQAPSDATQKQASQLNPVPRHPITKLQWRLLMDIPDDIIARELTRIDWLIFASVRPRDLIRHVSLSAAQKASHRNLAHVNRMIDHFNHLAFWVANYLLLRDKPKHRALMLEKLMRVARKLRELNNYNALGALIAGIRSSSIHRLAATRDLLSPAVGRDWLKLEILMAPSRSHFAYRLAWENSSAERIPYLPLLRRDLVSAEEGNRTFVDEAQGRINWKKFEIKGEVVVGVQRAQGTPYKGLGSGRVGDQVRELVLDVKMSKDEDELFERSKYLEPTGASSGSLAGAGPSTKLKEFFKR